MALSCLTFMPAAGFAAEDLPVIADEEDAGGVEPEPFGNDDGDDPAPIKSTVPVIGGLAEGGVSALATVNFYIVDSGSNGTSSFTWGQIRQFNAAIANVGTGNEVVVNIQTTASPVTLSPITFPNGIDGKVIGASASTIYTNLAIEAGRNLSIENLRISGGSAVTTGVNFDGPLNGSLYNRTLTVTGPCEIVTAGTNGIAIGMNFNLAIAGSGTLTVKGASSGIYITGTGGTLTINTAVTAESTAGTATTGGVTFAGQSTGMITSANGSKLIAKGLGSGSNGVYANGGLNVRGSVILEATGAGANGNGIHTAGNLSFYDNIAAGPIKGVRAGISMSGNNSTLAIGGNAFVWAEATGTGTNNAGLYSSATNINLTHSSSVAANFTHNNPSAGNTNAGMYCANAVITSTGNSGMAFGSPTGASAVNGNCGGIRADGDLKISKSGTSSDIVVQAAGSGYGLTMTGSGVTLDLTGMNTDFAPTGGDSLSSTGAAGLNLSGDTTIKLGSRNLAPIARSVGSAGLRTVSTLTLTISSAGGKVIAQGSGASGSGPGIYAGGDLTLQTPGGSRAAVEASGGHGISFFRISDDLYLKGGISLTASGGSGFRGINIGLGCIYLSDTDQALTVNNRSASQLALPLQIAGAGYQWNIAGDGSVTAGSITDRNLTWVLPAGSATEQVATIKLMGPYEIVETGAWYNNINDAVVAANAGQTIKALQNNTYTGTLNIGAGKHIILDPDGKTVNINGGAGTGLIVADGASLKLKDPNNGALNVSGANGVQCLSYAEVTNVTATGTGATNYGVYTTPGQDGTAKAVVYGSIKVTGAAAYINLNNTRKGPANYESVTTKEGFFTYSILDGNQTVWVKTPACEIVQAGVGYETLAAALEAVQHNQTIRLIMDISHTGGIVVDGKTVNFNLNGKKLNVSNTGGGDGLQVINGGQVKLIDPANGEFNVAGAGNGVSVSGGGKAEVSSVATSALAGAYAVQAAGANSEILVHGNVIVTGVNPASGGVDASGGAKITIDGAILVPTGGTYIRVGGAVKTPEDGNLSLGYLVYTGGSPVSTVLVRNPGSTPVCSIGTTEYLSLTPALKEAIKPGGGEIKMLKDYIFIPFTDSAGEFEFMEIPDGSEVTVNLNGKKLTVYSNVGDEYAVCVLGKGDQQGFAVFDLTDPYNGELNIIGERGVRVEDGTFTATGITGTGVAEGFAGSEGAFVIGSDSVLNVTGNVTATAVGIDARGDSHGGVCKVVVGGNVEIGENGYCGVSVTGRSEVTVEGKIIVPEGAGYVIVGGTPLTKEDGVPSTIKPGYLEYSDGISFVFVNEQAGFKWDGTNAAVKDGDTVILHYGAAWIGGGTLTVPAGATVDIVSTGSNVTNATNGITFNIGAGARVNWKASLAAATTANAVSLDGTGAFNVAGGAISNSLGGAIYTQDGTGRNNIILSGGTVSTTASNTNYHAIYAGNASASVTGAGTAVVNAAAGCAINSIGPVTVSGTADLTATGGQAGIYLAANTATLTVGGEGVLNANGEAAGIRMATSGIAMTISGTAAVTAKATGSAANNAGLYAEGNVTITNNSANAAIFHAITAGLEVAGIYAAGDLTLGGSGNINAAGTSASSASGAGIRMGGGNPTLTVTGPGTVTASTGGGNGSAIYYTSGPCDAVITGTGNLAVTGAGKGISFSGGNSGLTVGAGLSSINVDSVFGPGISFSTGNNTITANKPITFASGSGHGIYADGSLKLAGAQPITVIGGPVGMDIGAGSTDRTLTIDTEVTVIGVTGLRFGGNGVIKGAGNKTITVTGNGSGSGIASNTTGGPYTLTLDGDVGVEAVGGTTGRGIDAGAAGTISAVNFTDDRQTLTVTNKNAGANDIPLTMLEGHAWVLVSGGSISPNDINEPAVSWTVLNGETATIKLEAACELEKITIDKGRKIILAKGDTVDLIADYTPAYAPAAQKKVVWTSNNTAVATVEAADINTDPGKATVTARGSGSACVAVISSYNREIYDYIWVIVPDDTPPKIIIKSINEVDFPINSGRISVEHKKNITFSLTASNFSTGDPLAVTWASSDKKVATVSAAGLVKQIAPGTATITATSKNKSGNINKGDKATIALTLRDIAPRLPVSAIVLNTKSDGTVFNVLPTDTLSFNGLDIIKVVNNKGKEVDAAGTRWIDWLKIAGSGTEWRLRLTSVDIDGAVPPTPLPNGVYTVTMQAMDGGVPANGDGKFNLKVTVTDKAPKPTVKMPALNTFWKNAQGKISITGKNLPKVSRVELAGTGKPADGNVTQNFAVSNDGSVFVIWPFTGITPANKPAVKGSLRIYYEGFGVNYAEVPVTFSVKDAGPKLALSPASQTINMIEASLDASFGLTGGRIDTVAATGAVANNAIASIAKTDSSITVTLKNTAPAKNNLQLQVWLENATRPITVKPVVKTTTAAATYSLSAKTVTLNSSLAGQRQVVYVRPGAANVPVKTIVVTPPVVTAGITITENPADSSELTVSVPANAKAGTYKFKVSPNDTKDLELSVKVVTAAQGAKGSNLSAGVKADKGNIDLMDKGNTLRTFKPTLKGTTSEIIGVKAVSCSKPVLDSFAQKSHEMFDVSWNNVTQKVEVRAPAAISSYQRNFSYKMRFEFTLAGGSTLTSGDVTIKPAQGKVKHAVPKSVVKHQSRTGVENHVKINLKALTPGGARINDFGFKAETAANLKKGKYINNPGDAYWYYFDYHKQELHLWIKDGAMVKPGKATLKFHVLYEGQGMEKNTTIKPIEIKIPVGVLR